MDNNENPINEAPKNETINVPPTSASSAPKAQNALAIPIAIVIAGILIAGAVAWKSGGDSPSNASNEVKSEFVIADFSIREVSSDDHILGNPNASVVFVEYSDTECPFCKRFHNEMKTIIGEFGKGGEVAWVYRQFPLEQLHRKAPRESQATECVAEIAGNEAFWKYTDRIYEVTPSNDGLPDGDLQKLAVEVGVNEQTFLECLNSGRTAPKVEEDLSEAIASGGRGTPYTVVSFKDALSEKSQKAVFDSISKAFTATYGQALPGDLLAFSKNGSHMSLSGALDAGILRAIISAVVK